MRTQRLIAGLLAATLLAVAGCSSQKTPATDAVTAAESALEAVRAEATRYAPNDLQGVESALGSMKEQLARKEYDAVLAASPALLTSINSLKESTAARKVEFENATTEWVKLSADVPKMVGAIQSRVDTLSQSRRLPKNLTQGAFDSAKTGLETMKSSWNEASAAFTAGNPVAAVEKAEEVQAMGREVMRALGMTTA